ncbi:MAG: alpha-amylase family glycosyl hydrolase [Microthrixaceae bacterium]
MSQPWWSSAVVYQVYPRSFRDTTGTGVGDLRGIIDGLDHLAWLGVDALWLSPIYPSPMADHGYDVADYCDIDPTFGTLEDFDELLAEAHGRNLRVLLDWVPNHTSEAHPWFVESRASRENPKRSWYHWCDGTPDTPPNNWTRAFPAGQPAWSWDPGTEAWYLNLFSPEQPDLNWANPEVRAAMADTLRFWLDRGVDGFRMDVIHCLGKPEGLPDFPEEVAAIPAVVGIDTEATHAYLRELRDLLEGYDGDRVAIGEVYLLETAQIVRYYGSGDELHLAFNFPPMFGGWSATQWRRHLDAAQEHFLDHDRWPAWVLSNHDNPRHRTRYGGDEAVARAAAVLLLGLPGTPFLYAGEELGLEDALVPPERIVDPSGGRRDGCRAPIPWTTGPGHGWASADTWLPFPPEANERSVAAQRAAPDSMLALYRALLKVRAAQPALRVGRCRIVHDEAGVLAWRRTARPGEGPPTGQQRDDVLVVVNFTPEPAPFGAGVGWTAAVSSHPDRANRPLGEGLLANEALWAVPAGGRNDADPGVG